MQTPENVPEYASVVGLFLLGAPTAVTANRHEMIEDGRFDELPYDPVALNIAYVRALRILAVARGIDRQIARNKDPAGFEPAAFNDEWPTPRRILALREAYSAEIGPLVMHDLHNQPWRQKPARTRTVRHASVEAAPPRDMAGRDIVAEVADLLGQANGHSDDRKYLKYEVSDPLLGVLRKSFPRAESADAYDHVARYLAHVTHDADERSNMPEAIRNATTQLAGLVFRARGGRGRQALTDDEKAAWFVALDNNGLVNEDFWPRYGLSAATSSPWILPWFIRRLRGDEPPDFLGERYRQNTLPLVGAIEQILTAYVSDEMRDQSAVQELHNLMSEGQAGLRTLIRVNTDRGGTGTGDALLSELPVALRAAFARTRRGEALSADSAQARRDERYVEFFSLIVDSILSARQQTDSASVRRRTVRFGRRERVMLHELGPADES